MRVSRRRARFPAEVTLAALAIILAVLTAVLPDWIEVTGFDPDHHSGSVESAIVAVFAAVALCLAITASIEYRRPVAST